MGHSETVIDCVSDIAPKAICDDCLANKLNFSRRQTANQITRRLSQSPSFEKAKRVCSYCYETKLSISVKFNTQNSNLASKPSSEKPKSEKPKVVRLGINSLKEIGFQKIGLWVLNGDRLSLQLINNAELRPALYAFVADKEILYVGKTARQLKKRLYHYTRPDPTQSTNIRVNRLLIDALNERQVLEIHAFGTNEITKKGSFVLDIPAALEDDIIRKTRPIWNIPRSK